MTCRGYARVTGKKGTNLRAPRGGEVGGEDNVNKDPEETKVKGGRTNRRAPRGGHSEEGEGCCQGMTGQSTAAPGGAKCSTPRGRKSSYLMSQMATDSINGWEHVYIYPQGSS